MKWPEIAAALIGGGVLAKIIDVATGRRKARADTADVLTDAANTSIGMMSGVMAELREQVVALRNQNQVLVLEVGNLRKENADLRALVLELRDEVLQLKASADDGR